MRWPGLQQKDRSSRRKKEIVNEKRKNQTEQGKEWILCWTRKNQLARFCKVT